MKTACIQINSSNVMEANLLRAGELIRQAAAEGAECIFTPECVAYMSYSRTELVSNTYPMETHPALHFFQELALELKRWLVIGSLAVDSPEEGKAYNRAILLSPEGAIAAYYDKIHLFEMRHKEEKNYSESRSYLGGTQAVNAKLPWCTLGMTICYDLRFPYLYRALAHQGAECIMVPSAFTRKTGQAHWEILLRARAIETGCFIIAPGQTGTHPGERYTYGHSMIIDPWGEVLAEAGEEEGIILADIDLNRIAEVRKTLPSLQHDRDFT